MYLPNRAAQDRPPIEPQRPTGDRTDRCLRLPEGRGARSIASGGAPRREPEPNRAGCAEPRSQEDRSAHPDRRQQVRKPQLLTRNRRRIPRGRKGGTNPDCRRSLSRLGRLSSRRIAPLRCIPRTGNTGPRFSRRTQRAVAFVRHRGPASLVAELPDRGPRVARRDFATTWHAKTIKSNTVSFGILFIFLMFWLSIDRPPNGGPRGCGNSGRNRRLARRPARTKRRRSATTAPRQALIRTLC